MSARLRGEELLDALEAGRLRVAQRAADGTWTVQAWIKEELLALFRSSEVAAHGAFVDKAAFPPRHFTPRDGVRLVPGGSAIRRGAHVARGVVCMPPMYVNVGAFVGADTLIDSHALVGSCAQIGERVHLSAAAQIGGVLEPVGARPVIVEDDVFVGGGAGLYEGVLVRRGAVLAAGIVLTGSTPVHDLVRGVELGGGPQGLEIPENAVVVPGTRPATGEYARAQGLGIACALVVKYRDARTDRRTAREDALRSPPALEER
jgi:2,3,4,5-tetrahydropyridine-2-carboxylate N-succinyltransferase